MAEDRAAADRRADRFHAASTALRDERPLDDDAAAVETALVDGFLVTPEDKISSGAGSPFIEEGRVMALVVGGNVAASLFESIWREDARTFSLSAGAVKKALQASGAAAALAEIEAAPLTK
jgi:hypothetical protein